MKNFRDRKGVSGALVAIALVVLIICGSLFAYYIITQLQAEAEAEEEVFYGTVSVTISEDNYLDRGASVSTTSDSYIAYHTGGKSLEDATEDDFIAGTTFTVGTAKDVSVEQTDNGHFWLKCYTGTDFFLHVSSTGSSTVNPRIAGHEVVDVDNDNRLEDVYDIDVSDISDPLPVTKPPLEIKVMVVQEDTSLALNDPANQSSIGTGTKTGTIEWQLSGIAEKYGARLARLYVTSNDTTFETLAKVTGVEIDDVGTFTGSKIESDSGAKTWYIDIDVDDYREMVYTHLLTREQGGKSYVGITVSWETYFTSAGQGVTLTLYVQMIGADEAVDTALSNGCILGG